MSKERAAGVGLVLSGGGARGAYEVGVVRRLAEEGVNIISVSGASIGALNGALIASAPDLATAATRLEKVWEELADRALPDREGAMRHGALAALQLILPFAARDEAAIFEKLRDIAVTAHASKWSIARYNAENPDDTWLSTLIGLDPSVFNSSRLEELFIDAVPAGGFPANFPFYVSVLRSRGPLLDLISAVQGTIGFETNRRSEALLVQSLPAHEQRSAVLASAALPFIFEAHEVSRQHYADGGMSGWRDLIGNVPLQPLHDDRRCKVAVVVHLRTGVLFDRSRLPDLPVVEIRPRSTTDRQSGMADLLSFDGGSLRSWMSQGYDDCGLVLEDLQRLMDLSSAKKISKARLDRALERLRRDGSD